MAEILAPPFTRETALKKVQLAEDNWNSCDPARDSSAYSLNSEWRNRDVFLKGREAIREFLSDKWDREKEYRLKKEPWAFTDNRISVRFDYEWHDEPGQWFRAHGNEQWELDDDGLMGRRDASLNDYKINEKERRIGV